MMMSQREWFDLSVPDAILRLRCSRRVSGLLQVRLSVFFFFFQAEDGIRDLIVTGVQTCALPIFVPERTGEHAPILQKTAEDAAVLLKNDHALPLKPEDLDNLALIGPGAGQLIAIGASGEKALGHLDRQISPLRLLQELGHIHFAVADDMTGE